MDNIKVLVVTGGVKREYMFTRVPQIGERVQMDRQIYAVRKVLHTPDSDVYAAVIDADVVEWVSSSKSPSA
jgi:hypothetical protein